VRVIKVSAYKVQLARGITALQRMLLSSRQHSLASIFRDFFCELASESSSIIARSGIHDWTITRLDLGAGMPKCGEKANYLRIFTSANSNSRIELIVDFTRNVIIHKINRRIASVPSTAMYVCTSADRRLRRPNDHDDHRHCYSYIILRILLSSALPVISALHYQRARYHRVQRDSGIPPASVLVKIRVEKLNLVLSCPPIRGAPTIRRYQRRRGESTGAVTVNKIGVALVASRLIRGRACLHSASYIPSASRLCARSQM